MKLIEIKSDADFIVDMMYAKPTNMSGIDAYGQIGLGNRCFIRPEAAENLENLRPKLRAEHLKLKVFDGYRPPQSHTLMMNAMPVKGLYADSAFLSSHCHAAALDVCLCREDGEELDFPTKVDAYLPRFADEVHRGVLDGYRENLKKAAYAYTSGNARENENRAVTAWGYKIRDAFRVQKASARLRKDRRAARKAQRAVQKERRKDKEHIYRECPACGATLRLPRKQGKHTVLCPRCGNKFGVEC